MRRFSKCCRHVFSVKKHLSSPCCPSIWDGTEIEEEAVFEVQWDLK